MAQADIAGRARFDLIRYAQLWEDADVLLPALGDVAGGTLVSICAAGDNALAMLTLDPARVVAVDLSQAQLQCLRLRIAAMRVLEQPEFLELMGSRPTDRRGALFDRVLAGLEPEPRAFWAAQREGVLAHGAGGVGKFERYFRIFRQYLLPLVHSRRTIAETFVSRPPEARARFLAERFTTWRWRLLLNLFFSRTVMGRMGRDAAFFDHVDGSPAAHVARRIRHAAVDLDPADNPFLHWILTGTHGAALPMPWRPGPYGVIRDRLDRLDLRHGPLEAFGEGGERADGFNLSDIFEYMPPAVAAQVYDGLLRVANPGARLVYWNMMAPRRVPEALQGRVRTLADLEARLKAQDKAFFYSDFVIEEVAG
jgi:S-adenosylmethionine-diacylglycerol 3-amino-3-carboxypropyl transferase